MWFFFGPRRRRRRESRAGRAASTVGCWVSYVVIQLVIRVAVEQPYLDQREHEDDPEERVRHGCGVAHREILKTGLPDVVHDGRRCLERAAVRHDEDLIEDLKCADDAHDEQEER